MLAELESKLSSPLSSLKNNGFKTPENPDLLNSILKNMSFMLQWTLLFISLKKLLFFIATDEFGLQASPPLLHFSCPQLKASIERAARQKKKFPPIYLQLISDRDEHESGYFCLQRSAFQVHEVFVVIRA